MNSRFQAGKGEKMNPIYTEYIRFLRETTGQPLPNLKEGYFWLDRQIIKGFDLQGKVHKFYKIQIDSSLETVNCSQLKSYEDETKICLASWQQLIDLNKNHVQEIENNSLCLIKEKIEKYNSYTSIIPVSMGKDSMVTCHLIRQLYPETKAIFNNTSLDCADTYKMVKCFPNCEVMNPSKGFYQYVKSDHMIPSRMSRFCCRIFKTGVMVSQLDHDHPYLLWMGMRNEESNTRSGYEDEWINTSEWGNTCWQGILPIRKWTELDVWLYTIWKGIEINPKYKKGYSRCGCHCACPFYSKSTWILDKYWYPKAYKRWRNILKEDFVKNKKWIIMNCTLNEYLTQAWNGGTFRNEPTQEVIEEFAKYNNLDIDIAARYFNKECCNCNKRIKHKEVLSMNLKVNGRQANKFYCKKCLMKEFGWNKEDWDKQVALFKTQGCALF